MKKKLALLGMITALLLSFFGILTMSGQFCDGLSYPSSFDCDYDYGYASFNGDYYTYSVNNSALAADGSIGAAQNVADLTEFLMTTLGLFMLFFGIFAFCSFGIVYHNCKKELTEVEVITPPVMEKTEPESFEEDESAGEEEIADAQ